MILWRRMRARMDGKDTEPRPNGGPRAAMYTSPKTCADATTARAIGFPSSIALWDTAHQFKAGHRLGLLIRSHLFPLFARNLNTGEPVKDATRVVVAQQLIYYDAKRPSVLRFRQLNQ